MADRTDPTPAAMHAEDSHDWARYGYKGVVEMCAACHAVRDLRTGRVSETALSAARCPSTREGL